MSGFLLVIFGGHRRLRGGAQWNDSNRVHHLRLIHHVRYKRIYIYTYTPYKMYSLLFYFLSSFFSPHFFYYYYCHLSIRWWRLLYDRLPFNCYWTDALLAFAWKHASIRQATCKRYMFFSSGCDADAQASLILCVCVYSRWIPHNHLFHPSLFWSFAVSRRFNIGPINITCLGVFWYAFLSSSRTWLDGSCVSTCVHSPVLLSDALRPSFCSIDVR